jgi:DNA-binding GntR family transcriptional regulator
LQALPAGGIAVASAPCTAERRQMTISMTVAEARRAASFGTRKTSSREQIVTYICQRIFTGEYPPLSRIPQDEVAAAVGLTKIPIREALVSLEARGFVVIEAHKGAFVRPLSSDEIRCHFELRGYAGGMEARRAAQAGSKALVRDLQPLYRGLSRTEDPDEFLDCVDQFYTRMQSVGGSPVLTAARDRFHEIVPGNFFAIVPDSLKVGQRVFRDIYKAQRTFDPELALTAGVRASVALGECLIKLLDARGQLHDEVAEPS